jgi:hypothetical protein
MDKRSSLFFLRVGDERKSFDEIDTWCWTSVDFRLLLLLAIIGLPALVGDDFPDSTDSVSLGSIVPIDDVHAIIGPIASFPLPALCRQIY